MASYIIGTGTYLPRRTVSNDELSKLVRISPGDIFHRTGIANRHWADDSEKTSDLAANALTRALEVAEIEPREIDYLILGTMTPDRMIPGSAPAVQAKLGLKRIPCLDIRAGCCNGLYALQIASTLITSKAFDNIAISLSEIQSRYLSLEKEQGHISILFGDGASAMVLSSRPKQRSLRVIDVILETDGEHTDALSLPGSGTEFDHRFSDINLLLPKMKGQQVIAHAIRRLVEISEKILAKNNLKASEISWIVPHQANSNLLHMVANRLLMKEDQIINVLLETGNTSSASLGFAVDALLKRSDIHSGQLLILPAFGAGFMWGAGLAEIG